MTVRRPIPSNFAASVNDSPNAARHSAKSAPVIGCCASAIRRSVEAENVQTAPFRMDRPGHSKAIFHDLRLCKGLGIVHQRRKMCAASH
jgi:hypothetical protein